MQAIWKGTVSFGLVSIPVKLYAATEERGVSFRQVHDADGGRIKYKRVCSIDGEEVAYRDIAKGYELPDGDMVVLTDEDFAALPLPSRHTIDVLAFVPSEQIDGLYLSKGYYLSADGPGLKPYVLLRDALIRSGRTALVKVALRNRESLAVLRAREGTLCVQTMLWPDEVRDASTFAPTEDVDVREQEVAMAESYIDTLTEDFDAAAFTDDYRAALEELVTAKAGGRVIEAAEEPQAQGTVVDLMAALRASVEAAKQKRSAAEPAAVAPGKSAPAAGPSAKASVRKSAAAKKPAPGKAGATKTAKTVGTAPAAKTVGTAPAAPKAVAATKKSAPAGRRKSA